MSYKKLTPSEERVMIYKGTEAPFSGEYYNNNRTGKYFCKQCGLELFSSKDKFDSGCGWPSFDDEIKNSVKKVTDKDGQRTEILCAKCDGHLGHIFKGENFTAKNTRYCVNSICLDFVEEKSSNNSEKAYFGGGCFWGVEYYFSKAAGINSVLCGYMGGKINSPTYEQVCSGNSGHIEIVEVNFNPQITNFKTLCQLFFETHNPTEINRQGPDIGQQYQSVIFYTNQEQQTIAQKLITILENKGHKIATKLKPATTFWPAEPYHQNYYHKNGKEPYCHIYTKRF
jgi:peptide methionine sulfoxide reductase msrA/msrB